MPSDSARAPRTLTALTLLGVASGLPLALTEDTLQAWLRDVGYDLATVGFITIVGLPNALQVLWAPLVDRYAPRFGPLRLLGRRRAWLLTTQFLLAGAIVVMGLLGPRSSGDPLALFALAAVVVALLSATQDIALNAYRTDVLPDRLRGPGASAYIVGYRVGMIATGAGVLALADHLPWSMAWGCAAVAMTIGLLGSAIAPEPPEPNAAPPTLADAVVAPLASFLARPAGLLLLLFVFLFKLPDYLASRMTLPFLLDAGLSKTDIAAVRQAFGIAMTIVGAVVGGGLLARVGLLRGLLAFGILQAVSNAGFLLLSTQAQPGIPLVAGVIAVEAFCTGLVAAGFVAFLMACCERRHSATQYALLTSTMLLGSRLAGPVAGVLAERLGWTGFFLVTIAAALPGLAMLLPVARRVAR